MDMNAKQQNYLGLLEALKLSLSNNQFSKINIIIDELNETISHLKKKSYYNLALIHEVGSSVDLIRKFIAYDDLRLDANQSKVWDTLKETLEKDMTNSRQALNLSGSFGFTFNG